MPEIYHMIYVSEAARLISETDITDILSSSVRNNKAVDVSGLLIFRAPLFLQLLEGSRPAVRHVYTRIKDDVRHRNSEILVESTSKQRLFPNWQMGKLFAGEIDVKLPDIVPLLRTIHSDNTRSTILRVLKEFSKASGQNSTEEEI